MSEITVEAMDTAQPIPIEEMLNKASEKLDADFSTMNTKIHRFPAILWEIGEDGNYIVPKMVAIGTNYHGLPELQEMEEVKKAAA